MSYDVIPIFPLPHCWLFPHAVLPLHVFEPRYRELVRDCMNGDRRLAIATLEPGYQTNYYGRPSVRPLIGLGELVAHEPLEDGRSNILLRGIGRARIVEELPPDHSYRVVRVELEIDRYAPTFDQGGAQRTLLTLADRLADKLQSGGDTLRQLARSQDESGALADVLAAAVVAEAAERQRLFETLDVDARVSQLAGELAALLAQLDERRGPLN